VFILFCSIVCQCCSGCSCCLSIRFTSFVRGAVFHVFIGIIFSQYPMWMIAFPFPFSACSCFLYGPEIRHGFSSSSPIFPIRLFASANQIANCSVGTFRSVPCTSFQCSCCLVFVFLGVAHMSLVLLHGVFDSSLRSVIFTIL